MLVTPKQMQKLEQLTDAAGVSYGEMMERAGTALAAQIRAFAPEARTALLLAGSGNNGGDCYVAAACLRLAGWDARILAPFGAPKTEISRNAAGRAAGLGVPILTEADSFLATAEVIVDGLFGTGFHGTLPEAAIPLLAAREGQIRIAADIPSGGNAASGGVSEGTFRADLTVTFGAEKLGMTQFPLRSFCGKIVTAEIGIPAHASDLLDPPAAGLLTLGKIRAALPCRRPDAHKNLSGHLLTVAGSVRMRGACVLAVTAAMRSGAGLQTAASAEAALQAICGSTPEVMCLPLATDAQGFLLDTANHEALTEALRGKQALLLGCGMGVTAETRNLTKFLLRESDCPIIIDADGLNCLADCIDCLPKGRTILTPHPGEAARLLGMTAAQVQADRPSAAQRLAELTGAVIALKGAGTILTDGTRMAVCTLGNAGMARAGSGDVLAGITASLAAQGMPLYEAACSAVTLHAAAGDAAAKRLPMRYMLPQDLISALAEVL